MRLDEPFKRRPFGYFWPRCVVAVGVMLPLPAAADTFWEAALGLTSEYTDNANKSPTDPFSERQDELRLMLAGDYENDLIDLGVNYRASQRRFNQGTQENRSRLVGDSELLIGKAHHPADLLLSHNRRTVLNAPDDLDLLRNTDERQIFSAVPTLRWRPTRADIAMLRGTYAHVDYRFNSQRNSERVGASAIWQRSISATDTMTLNLQQMEVSFDENPTADYRYYAYSLAYAVELRRLDYRIELGYNESDPTEGDRWSSPSVRLDIGYDSGLNQWGLTVNRFITDNSVGSGNQGAFDGFTPSDSSAAELDQLERTRAEFSWSSQVLCQRCSSSLTLFYQEDDYRTAPEDRREWGGRLATDYRLSLRASVGATLERRNYRFSEDVPRDDYRSDRLQLRYNYNFLFGLDWSVYVRWEDRSSGDAGRRYDETVGGMRFDYSF